MNTNQNPTTQNQQQSQTTDKAQANKPDYIAMQYRVVRIEDGLRTRKERIGAAFTNANGSICFRPSGRQIIDNDVYLFPNNDQSPE